jgi:hypothetical protein
MTPDAVQAAKLSIQLDESVARILADALRRVRFGTISLTIHDGHVVEVDETRRTRLSTTK